MVVEPVEEEDHENENPFSQDAIRGARKSNTFYRSTTSDDKGMQLLDPLLYKKNNWQGDPADA